MEGEDPKDGSSVDAPSITIMENDTSKKATELSKQLGAMTLKNIVQESEGGLISLQDLCDQFASRAKLKEREAVGLEGSEVLLSLRMFPGMFVIMEADELDEIKCQLAENTSIPALLSGILKITGILKTKGSLSVEDLSEYFGKSCTEVEKVSLGENPELLKETLLALPNVLHVSGDMVSMVVEKEQPSVTEEDSGCHANDTNALSDPAVPEGQGEKLEDPSNETKDTTDQESEQIQSKENLSKTSSEEEDPSDTNVTKGDDDPESEHMQSKGNLSMTTNKEKDVSNERKGDIDNVPESEQTQSEENISKGIDEEDESVVHQEKQSVEVPLSYDQNQDIDIEVMASSDEFETDEDVDVEGLGEEQPVVQVEQSNQMNENGIQGFSDKDDDTQLSSETSTNGTSSPEANGPLEKEKPIDIPAKLAKQLGIMKIKEIVQEKGSMSLQLLGSVFGGRGTAEERDALGRKAKELLETIQEFGDVFCFETLPEQGESLWDQMFISVISPDSDNEASLAFSRAVGKMQDILEEKGSLKITQLSTFLNQSSSLEEKASVGKGPPTLQQTLCALPGIFRVLDECVYTVNRKETTVKKPAEDPAPVQAQMAVETASQLNDFSNVNVQLGILTIKSIIEEHGTASLQVLCSRFGNKATDGERDAIGRKANEILKTLKKFHQVFFIKSPKESAPSLQAVNDQTKIRLVKGGGVNKTSVPYAKAIFLVIWFLKEKGSMDIKHLSTRLGQNSSPSEREAVGKSPGELKKTLRGLPKLFKVSGNNISIVGNEAHVLAASLFILPAPPVRQANGQPQAPDKMLSIMPTVVKCLRQYNGSCDLTRIIQWINTSGSTADQKKYGSDPKELLKQLKMMPDQFLCQGSKVILVNQKSGGGDGQGAASLLPMSNLMQGVGLQQSPAKVIPSIEIVFDAKNGHGDSWRNVSFTQAISSNSSNQSQNSATAISANNIPPPPPTTKDDAKKTKATKALEVSLERITTFLEQRKIATVIQLGGVVGSKGTAAERKAVGKNPDQLYDTLASLPDRFAMAGPFVGVKGHQDLVTGVANLVTFLETKGRCEIAELFGKLIQRGTAKQQAALGIDIDTFTKTIDTMPGIFTLYETSVYLNNGSEGKPCASTSMNKATALNQNVLWALSTGTTAQSVSPSVARSISLSVTVQNSATSKQGQTTDTSASTSAMPLPLASRLGNPTLTITDLSINDSALCEEFKQNCLDKYEYPIIGLAVDQNKHIAIAGWEDYMYLFDMEEGAISSTAGMNILRDVIANTKILKVVHNCENVSAILNQSYGFKLHNVFDTRIAYQLESGHASATLTKLCNEYGVATPAKWKTIKNSNTGAAGGRVGETVDGSLAVRARVLIPQIYQHMVMKISADSLKEVGKLCEERSVSSYLPVKKSSSMASIVTTPASSTVSSDHMSTSAASSSSSQGVPSYTKEGLSSKVCDYLLKHGPSPMTKLFDFLYSDVTGDLAEFQTVLESMPQQYICLDSGLVDFVKHVHDYAIVKILDVLKEKGALTIQQLLEYFKEVATADEIRVVARTNTDFKKTLRSIGFVTMQKGGIVHLTGLSEERGSSQEIVSSQEDKQINLQSESEMSSLISEAPCTSSEISSASSIVSEAIVLYASNGVGASYDENTNIMPDISQCQQIAEEPQHSDNQSDHSSEDTLPNADPTMLPSKVLPSKLLKPDHVTILQHYVNKNGLTTKSELQNILANSMGQHVPSKKLLEEFLRRFGGCQKKFSFLQPDHVGPNTVAVGAAEKIAKFLDTNESSDGDMHIDSVLSWFNKNCCEVEIELFGTNPENYKSGLTKAKLHLKKNLKAFPHLFMVDGNSVSLQSPQIETNQTGSNMLPSEGINVSQNKKWLKPKHVNPLYHFVNKNGPTSISDLQSILSNEMGPESVPSAKELEEDLGRHHTKFTILQAGYIGPNTIKVGAADNIARFLSSNDPMGCGVNIESVLGWFNQHCSEMEIQLFGTNPERNNQGLKAACKCLKKHLGEFPHLFQAVGSMVYLKSEDNSKQIDQDSKLDDNEGASASVSGPSLNPWGITKQLRDQFAARNKQDMDALKVLGDGILQNLNRIEEEGDTTKLSMLTEIVLDCGRVAQARFYQKDSSVGGYIGESVSSSPVTQQDIQSVLDSDLVTTPTPDKRAGIEGTLHRLGLIYNRSGRAIGLTACIGRAVLGCVDHIHDILHNGQSLVLLGSPGVGVTTVLREMARVLSDVRGRRVVIIDTYNQISGDSDIPHPAIGTARRLQVSSLSEQHKIMDEAVKNHNPQTIIIDEMSTVAEAQTIRNLVQRGVQVIAAAHASNFVDFIQNHDLRHVTAMSQGAELSGGKKPAFQVLIELCERDRWVVYKDLASCVDLYRQGVCPFVEERQCTLHRSRRGNLIGPVWTTKLIEAQIPLTTSFTV